MENRYRYVSGVVPGKIAENVSSYTCLTERHIQALWLEQKYFKHLKTSDGHPIKILSPGIWNADAGPDFLRAHLEINGVVLKGDVEIHLSDSGWTNHGHHQDARYNQVVLHLSLWSPRKDNQLRTLSHGTIHKAYLEPSLTVSPQRLTSLIDLELYPYKKFVGSGKCSQQLFKGLSPQNTEELFSDAALWRLQQKCQRLKAETSNPRLWMGAGIAMALGYKRNAEAFLQLYLWLYRQGRPDEKELFSLCLKACGFFSESYQIKWGSCPYYQELLKLIPQEADTPSVTLNMLKIRPFNHPIRRLAYLAKLTADVSHYTLSERLLALWEECYQEDPHHLRQQMTMLLPDYADPFWEQHYIFGAAQRKKRLSLLGTDLKNRILVNTFLPLLADLVEKKGSKKEWEAFKIFYAAFPYENTSKTRYLTHRFFGDTPKGELMMRADLEQGAYQIHRDFCLHYEASCEGCPFVERHRTFYTTSSIGT